MRAPPGGRGEVWSGGFSLTFFGKGACGTGTRGDGFRSGEAQFRPDGLARKPILGYAPTVCERVHEKQAAPRLGVQGGLLELGQPFTARIRHLNTEDGAAQVKRESEVPARYTAVGGGVGRQLGHKMARGVRREAPAAELFFGEQASETGTARRGGQQHAEGADGPFA